MLHTLTGPFCPPIDGTWTRENGGYLPSVADCGPMGRFSYQHDASDRAQWCERNGIPTGVVMPMDVIAIIDRAFGRRAYPDQAAPVWAEARRMLALAQAAMAVADDDTHTCPRCGELVSYDGCDGCRDPMCAARERIAA